jgi:peptidoglycan/xylan/chitin deacetylase (PgdA/CDA1 family)
LKKIIKKVIANSSIYKLKKERFIFLFHDISHDYEIHHSPQYSIRPDEFFSVMNFIRSNFHIVGIDEIVSEQDLNNSRPLASIVFDDGFYSIYKNAYPYLLENELKFALFINKKAVVENELWFTSFIINANNNQFFESIYKSIIDTGKISIEQFKQLPIPQIINYVKEDSFDEIYTYVPGDSSGAPKLFCDEVDLRKILESGLATIHSHGASHLALTRCSDKLIFKEIDENKQFVESITNNKSIHFGIPFGKAEHYNEKIIQQCKQLGYKYLFSSNPNSFSVNDISSPGFIVPRISIANGNLSELSFVINMNIIKKRNL